MNKKNNAKKIAALLLGAALAVGSVGCGNFIVTDSEKDLAQTVAKVDISANLTEEYQDVAGEVAEIVGSLSKEISKRDLVISFLSTGYQDVQNGYGYEYAFTRVMDTLVSQKIMIQYAVAYFLKNTSLTAADCKRYVEEQKAAATEKEKELYEAYPEVLTLKYFLTDGGNDDTDYDVTVYNLKKSLNDSLDSIEKEYIKAEEHDHDEETETRTLPNGVTTEKEDYSNENYGVYTGRNAMGGEGGFGDYKKQEGSTSSTRQKAYNAFLANLQQYNLIGSEDTADVTKLSYYYVELSSLLGVKLINKYFETMEDTVTAAMTEGYMQSKYAEIKAAQQNDYEEDPTAFATAMGSVSNSSFLLHGLEGFGYVYNILLPFSTSQNVRYSEAKNNKSNTQNDIYAERRAILAGVKGKDLRESWISVHDAHNHSTYVKGQDESEPIKFFQDHLGENAQYEKLGQYQGDYAYNGKVNVDDDGELVFTPKEIDIDEFLDEFKTYVGTTAGVTVSGALNTGTTKKFSNPAENYISYDVDKSEYTDDEGEVKDYSSFIYYTGKVEGLGATAKDYFKEGTTSYKAISAVNELMFAYSTDTGCLNTHFGYAVSPYKTDFVKEFEYAAREAIKGGAGSYVVCATDYGWHIVYASYVYDASFMADGTTADVYGGYVEAEKDIEGTFSNLFYESLKTSAAQNYSTEKQNEVLNTYNNDKSVSLYESRYKDLLELE